MVEKMENGQKSLSEQNSEIKKKSFMEGRSVDDSMEVQFPGSEA